jgi:hypothetical protein
MLIWSFCFELYFLHYCGLSLFRVSVCFVILFCCVIFYGSTKTFSEFYVQTLLFFLLSLDFLMAPSLYKEWQVLSAPPWNLQAYYKVVAHHSSAQEVFLLKALP